MNRSEQRSKEAFDISDQAIHVKLPTSYSLNTASVSKQFVSTKNKLTESWYSTYASKHKCFYESTASALDINLQTTKQVRSKWQLQHNWSVGLVLPKVDVLARSPSFVNDNNFQLVSLHILHVCGVSRVDIYRRETGVQFWQWANAAYSVDVSLSCRGEYILN